MEKSLNLGHLAEEFAKLLVDVPTAPTGEDTIQLEEGERREVTILFLDIVGYTRLAEQLDPEQLKFVISNTLQVFTNQIKKCGGTVEKYVGDAIMALFGRAEAHEDDSRRAVTAARAIIDKLEDINSILAQKGLKISARIGINRGLIVTGHLGEHDTVTGEAINIAQRLEANAPEDGILISDRIYQDCIGYYECQSLPPLFVKNKTEPLTVFLVTKEVTRRQPAAATQGPFVGRESELAILRAAWEQTLRGRMGVVQILGDAGVGKTALMAAFEAQRPETVAAPRVVRISADSFGMTPLHALSDLVRDGLHAAGQGLDDFIAAVAAPEVQSGLQAYRRYLRDLLGEVLDEEDRAELGRMEPRARQAETLLALKRFLEAMAAADAAHPVRPLLITIDNLQWVTHASREALAQLLHTLSPTLPLLWVMAGRGQELSGWLAGRVAATTVALTPLSAEAASQLVRERLAPKPVTEHLCRQLFVQSGGNALFLTQLIGEISLGDGTLGLSYAEALPNTIKALVLSRLDRLQRPQKFALQVAAVAGREFSADLLTHVLKRIGAAVDVEPVLDSLSDDQFLRRGEQGIAIAQPMMAEVAYSTILYANRRKLHQLVAQWVEEHRPDISMYAAYLAEQWERAENYPKAFHYAADAGLSAKRRYAYRDAANFLERAVRLAGLTPQADPAIVTEVCITLSDVYEALGDPDKWRLYIETGLQRVEKGSPTWQLLKIRAIEAEHRYGQRELARTQLQTLLAEPQVIGSPELHLKGIIAMLHFIVERGEDDSPYIEQALQLRPQITDAKLLYLLDQNIFNHYKNANALKQAEEYFSRVLEVASKNAYTQRLCDLLYCSFMWDRGAAFETILDRARRAEEYYREIGWSRGVGWGTFYRGATLWRLSRYGEAREVFVQGLQWMEQARDQYMVERLELVMAAVALFRGEAVEYQVRKSRILERVARLPEGEQQAMRREFAVFEGQAETERHKLTKIYETLMVTGSAPLHKVEVDEYTITLAYVAAQLGHVQEAAHLLDKVAAHVRENDKQWLMGLLARVEGMIAAAREAWDAMEQGFAESALLFHQLGDGFDTYLTYRAWWRALRQRGVTTGPNADAVRQALQQCETYGRPREVDA